MLSPFRALDMTDGKGSLCGKILADLGAEVIKVERPEGDSSRDSGAFYLGIPGPERSLSWFAFNQGKKSVTLNLETGDGQQILKRLVQTSHFLIESFEPAYLDRMGLGYEVMSQVNPSLVMTSITPFGQTGPYKDYKAEDITIMAMGGIMNVSGDPDRPPLRISAPQAYLLAGAQAAAATLTAHYFRQVRGEGQHVDVSAQQCVMSVLGNILPLWELSQINLKRVGSYLSGRGAGGIKQRMLFPCKDGNISFAVMGGPLLATKNRAMVKWMEEEEMVDDFIRNFNWDEYDLSRTNQQTQNRLEEYFIKFLITHTKAEIYNEGLKRGFMVAPVSEPRDILNNPQLKAREFWLEIEQPDLAATLTYPGAFYKSSQITPKKKLRPPHIGEHNLEIYEEELGISKERMQTLKKTGAI
jgi:crotonobetainyl-CoA:carnitine CoA-transferase CaiB-like acyl-CoA transferase